MKKGTIKNFTLLEAVIAMLILTLGLGILISQFALSGRRLMDEYTQWQISHELANTCEYILSITPEKAAEGLAAEFADEAFETSAVIKELQLPEELEESNNGAMRLINWHVEIKDKKSGVLLESADFPGWVEEKYAP